MEQKIKEILGMGKNKWEIKTLEEIATDIYSGNGVTEAQLGKGDYPAVKNKDLSKLPHQFTECRSFINPDEIKNKKYCEHGDVLMSCLGGEKAVGQVCVYLGNRKCVIGNVW